MRRSCWITPDGAPTIPVTGRALIFGLQEAILVTQNFHLPRALYVCNALGLPSVGVPADLRSYLSRSLLYWNLREVPATLVALWEVHISRPEPILGKPEPIFPLEAQ